MYFNKQVGAHKNKKKANFIFSNFPLLLICYVQMVSLYKNAKKNICVAICFGFPHSLTGLQGLPNQIL